MNKPDLIIQMIMGAVFIAGGLFMMLKCKGLSEAFVASNKAFNETMGWRVRPSGEKLIKFQAIFLFICGLLFSSAGLFMIYVTLKESGF